jgi:hypothetical protein
VLVRVHQWVEAAALLGELARRLAALDRWTALLR